MITKEQIGKDAIKFLKENSTGVLATSFDNIPHAATVYYMCDDDLNFYFVTKINTTKYFHLSNNAKVVLVVGTGPNPISARVHGSADFVFGEEKTDMLERWERLFEHNVKPVKSMNKFRGRDLVLFKIVPESIDFFNLDIAHRPETVSGEYQVLE